MNADTAAPQVDTFAREARAAGAVVHGPVAPEAVEALVVEQVERDSSAVRRVLAWRPEALGMAGLWTRLEARGIEPVCPALPDEKTARAAALSALDGIGVGLTSVVGALADTGTCVLGSGPDRPRLAWLLPPRHVVIVATRMIEPDMPSFFASRGDDLLKDLAHLAFVTGPSRTADIELTLTRGVHGPREVHIVLTTGSR